MEESASKPKAAKLLYVLPDPNHLQLNRTAIDASDSSLAIEQQDCLCMDKVGPLSVSSTGVDIHEISISSQPIEFFMGSRKQLPRPASHSVPLCVPREHTH